MSDGMDVIDVGDGIELGVTREGSGPPVLLVGGLGMPAMAWTIGGVTEALVDAGFEVITYHARGIAPSSAPPPPYTVDDLAGDALRLLDRLGIDRVHVVAYSMGCYVTQALLRAAPGRVIASVFLAGMQSSPIGLLVNEMELGLIERLGEIPPEVMIFEQLTTTLHTGALQDPDTVRGWRMAFAAGTDLWTSQDGLHGQLTASHEWMLAGEPTPEHLAAIDVPALVIAYEHDLFFPPKTSQQAAALIPDSEFLQIDGVAHGGLMTAQDRACAAAITRFMLANKG